MRIVMPGSDQLRHSRLAYPALAGGRLSGWRPYLANAVGSLGAKTGEPHAELAAAPHLAADLDGGAVGVDDPPHQRQPQPGAARAPRRRSIQLPEGLENVFLAIFRDADAGVAHA